MQDDEEAQIFWEAFVRVKLPLLYADRKLAARPWTSGHQGRYLRSTD
jgi:hypothetical protein